MTQNASDRLHRVLGGPALAALRQRLRKRFEQGKQADQFTLNNLTLHEREALAALLGRPVSRAGSMQLSLQHLDTSLQQGGLASSLLEALTLLDGPIVNQRALQQQTEADWNALLQASHPVIAGWLTNPYSLGLLKRLSDGSPARARKLLEEGARVLQSLPQPGIPLARLAADTLGDAHGLDRGQPLATLVLACLRYQRSQNETLDETERARDSWASAGILVNELAKPALVLNLPGSDLSLGEPGYLSLRYLVRRRASWDVAKQKIFVCENPNVVAIASDTLGNHCAPLVCTDGMPAAAQRSLLQQLKNAGAQLFYHGDFDWPGIQIGNQVMAAYGAQPWRYSNNDYIKALESGARGKTLEGNPVNACWDDELSKALLRMKMALHEEALVDGLLEDLAR